MTLSTLLAGSTLDRERRMTAWILYLLPGLVLTGLLTWVTDRHDMMIVQALFLAHALLGLLTTPLALLYVLVHFIRTLGSRSFAVFFSGIAAAGLTSVVLLSGVWLLIFGQTETTRWVLAWHIGSSLLLMTIALLHLFFYVHYRNSRKRSGSAWPSTEGLKRRRIAVHFAIQFFLVMVVSIAFNTRIEDSYLSVPEDYSRVYGEHPLRPSETEILGGDLLKAEVVGGSDECGSCHADIFKQWSASAHRKAAMDPAYERIIALLVENKGIEATRYCDGCHGPMALLPGLLTPGGQHSGIDDTPANHEGVTCVGCHSIQRPLHTKGVASYEFAPRRPYLFEYSNNAMATFINHRLIRMRPELHRQNFSAARISTPEVCATCHAQFMDKDMNDWGWIKMQDEYADWLDSPYSGRSNTGFTTTAVTTCTDCHMEDLVSTDPSASPHGNIRGHAFATANTFIPLTTGDPEHLEAVRRFLMSNKMRLTIDVADNPAISQSDAYVDEQLRNREILPDYYYLGQTVKANVLVSNTGVGHNFPGGTIDINEAWVAIQVVDATGQEIFNSGALDEAGHVDPSAWFYRSVAVDRTGKQLWRHDLFRMTGEHYRNVIPAGKTDNISLEFEVPQWATSPLTVSAQLNYRKLTQRYASWVMQDENIRLPVVVMAQDAVTLPVLTRPPTRETK